MATCPNKAHPDYKALETKYGKEGALKRYIENGYEIPDINGGKKLAKTKVKSMFDGIKQAFKSKSTLDSLEKHPEVFAEIMDEMNNAFPWVKVFKNRIIDENGNYIEIEPDGVGKHYKSAVMSAIAYANDSYIETVPHEYAHEYIEMYLDTPLVQEAIKKYGSKENLVTLIGRKYTGRKMSSSFERFLQDFWRMIRDTFGSPNVIDILTDNFAKNEALGVPVIPDFPIENDQLVAGPLTDANKNKGIAEYNDEFSSNSQTIQYQTDSQVERHIWDKLGLNYDYNMDQDVALKKFQKWWGGLQQQTEKLTSDETGAPLRYAGLSEKRINDTNSFMNGNWDFQSKVIQKIKGEQVEFTKQEQSAFNTITDLVKAYEHKKLLQENYVSEKENKFTNRQLVEKDGLGEVRKTLQIKKERLEKAHPAVRWAGEWLNKGIKHVTNNRLWTKYISGSESSVVSTMLHKAINNGRETYSRFTHQFEDFFKNENAPKSYMEGSIYNSPKADIDSLSHDVFELSNTLDQETERKSIKLTKAEQLGLYLIARQEGGRADLQEGFMLDKIKGREINLATKFKFTDEQIDQLIAKIEGDTEAMNFISEIDEAMDFSYNNLNPKFKMLEGYDLPKIPNYFPKYHGKATSKVMKTRNLIEDMRSFRERSMSGGMAVRLSDPFQVLNNVKINNATYSAYAIPIHNARKMVSKIKDSFEMQDTKDFINSIEDTLNKVQDPGLMFSTQGESKFYRFLNRLQNNFGVAMLAKNLGVVLKQQVSLETAKGEIASKYIRQSGPSVLGMSFINPIDLLRRLSLTGFKGGETWMPVEWTQLTENVDWQTLMKYPLYRDRFMGMVSREAGEAIMGKAVGEDKIKLPFVKKDGKPVYITKSRLMMGITIMDTMTILRLYNAVKLETQDRMGDPKFANMTAEEIEQHNVNRLQDIIDKTQPTFDQTNRTSLARDSNPLVRAITMFSSASAKIGMQNIDAVITYFNNPTTENRKRLQATIIRNAITTTLMLTTIDVLFYGLRFGFDDDDWEEMPSKYAWSTFNYTLGSIQGVGTAAKLFSSRLDSNPWYQTVQDPVQYILTEGVDGAANLAKGNVWMAVKQLLNAYAKTNGLPVTPYNNFNMIRKRITE